MTTTNLQDGRRGRTRSEDDSRGRGVERSVERERRLGGVDRTPSLTLASGSGHRRVGGRRGVRKRPEKTLGDRRWRREWEEAG